MYSSHEGRNNGFFYLICDSKPILLGHNAIHAFDVLVKFHYCFNLQYNDKLAKFFNFLAGCIMRLEPVKPSVNSLHTDIINSSGDLEQSMDWE